MRDRIRFSMWKRARHPGRRRRTTYIDPPVRELPVWEIVITLLLIFAVAWGAFVVFFGV